MTTYPVPTITFQVSLTPFTSETIGPNTSSTTTYVLSPDAYNDADIGTVAETNRASNRSTLLPTINLDNRILHHGDTFVEYGSKAIYLRNTYGIGYAPADRAYLTIVSVA